MARVANKLTDTQIKNAKPRDKAYTLSDGQGLQLLISPDGRKSWEFLYLSPTQHKRRKTSFSIYPKVSLSNAREKREEYQQLLFKGIDPIDKGRETEAEKLHNEASLFKNVVNEWFEFQICNLAESTYTKKKALFDKIVIPIFQDRMIETITHAELVQIVKLKANQTPETAKRLLSYFNDLWQYACSHNYCKFNIVANIHRKSVLVKTTKKHYANITDPIILKDLVNKIYKYGGHISTKNALKFVLHVPLRASNLVGLKWSYIDFDNQSLTIPRNEMKVKVGKDFILPLTDEAIKILKEQYLFKSNREYVFVADTGKHLNEITPSRALQRLGFNSEELGNKQRLHSFRGTFRSLANTHQLKHNMDKDVKESVLDHAVGGDVERAYTYNSDYFEQIKILLNWWSGFVLDMVEAKR